MPRRHSPDSNSKAPARWLEAGAVYVPSSFILPSWKKDSMLSSLSVMSSTLYPSNPLRLILSHLSRLTWASVVICTLNSNSTMYMELYIKLPSLPTFIKCQYKACLYFPLECIQAIQVCLWCVFFCIQLNTYPLAISYIKYSARHWGEGTESWRIYGPCLKTHHLRKKKSISQKLIYFTS